MDFALLGDVVYPEEYGVLAVLGSVIGIVSLIVAIISIIAMWKIFKKAGEAGWKSIIPIYNTYTLFKISDCSFWKWFLMFVGGTICSEIASVEGMNGAIVVICGIAGLVLSIWALVLAIKMTHSLSKNFGHDVGFTLGLIFLPFIFMLILAFGSSQYKANAQQSQPGQPQY